MILQTADTDSIEKYHLSDVYAVLQLLDRIEYLREHLKSAKAQVVLHQESLDKALEQLPSMLQKAGVGLDALKASVIPSEPPVIIATNVEPLEGVNSTKWVLKHDESRVVSTTWQPD